MSFTKRQFATVIIVFLLSFVFLTVDVVHAGVLTLDVNIAGDPTEVQTGEIVEYIIDFSCGGTTSACGDLTLTVDVDDSVFIANDPADIEVNTSFGYSGSFNPSDPLNGGLPTVRITDNENGMAEAFADGDSAQAIVRVRVRYDLTGSETIPFNVVGVISTPDTPGDASVSDTAPLVPVADLASPEDGWEAEKVQISPQGGIGPAAGGEATYEVRYCAATTTGNVSINDARLVDTFPTGAVVVPGSFTDGDGNPTTDETVMGNQITWDLGNLDIETIANSGQTCVERRYTLSFPAGVFPEGTNFSNTLQAFEDAPTDPVGPCTVNCELDMEMVDDMIDPPTANPTTSKTGPGDTIISPLNTSNSVYNIQLNTSAANVPIEDLILSDSFPRAISDPTLPAIEIIEITSGQWADNTITARVQYSVDGGTNWIDFAPGVDADGTGVTYAGPGPNVTDVRWIFEPDDVPSQIPAGFGFTTNPTVRFRANPGLDQTAGSGDFDGSEPGGSMIQFRDYENCTTINYSVDGTPDSFTSTGGGCANA
ncbi:MAG: hypothetical protein AAF787_03725, partial [Chloroflexota bacterium]